MKIILGAYFKMKSKRFNCLLAMLVCVCLSVGTAALNVFSAYAEDETETAVYTYNLRAEEVSERVAYEHTFNYIVKTDKDGNEVSLSTGEIENVAAYVADASYNTNSADKSDNCVFKDGKIMFRSGDAEHDYYVVKFSVKDYKLASETEDHVFSVRVKTFKKADSDSLAYKDFSVAGNKELLDSVKAKVADAAAKIVADKSTTYKIPDEIKKLVVSKYYNMSDLKYFVYYCTPTATSFTYSTSTTGTLSSITSSSNGNYMFYVTYQDDDKNIIETSDDYKLKYGTYGFGYYDESDKLIIPVFEYVINKTTEIEIKAEGGKEEGFINYRYDDLSFDITNGDNPQFELKYSADGETWVDAIAYDDDKKDNSAAHAKFDLDSFTKSSITFTPLKKGYYKVVCYVVEANGGNKTASAVSEEVKVEREYKEVKPVDERFKNFIKGNWQSLIFLSIAVLSFIGIIILIFVKPKEEVKASATVKAKALIGEVPVDEETDNAADDSSEANKVVEDVSDETAEEPVAEEKSDETSEETDNATEDMNNDSAEIVSEPAEEKKDDTDNK